MFLSPRIKSRVTYHDLAGSNRASAEQRELTVKKKSASPQKRLQGRPASAASGVGRDRIIAGTVDLLQQKRPADITRGMVATKLGIDPKLVNYYFGDLDNLIDEALEQIVSDLSAVMAAASETGSNPHERVRNRIAALTRFFIRNPYAWQMLAARVYESDSAWAKQLAKSLNTAGFDRLERIIRLGREAKHFAESFDERLLYVALIGLSEIFVTARPVVELIAPDLGPDDAEERYITFISDLVLNGISGPSPSRGKRK